MSVTQDIEFFAGEDKLIRDTIYQEDGVTVENITGWSIEFRLEKHSRETSSLVTKSVGSGVTITDGPNGVFEVQLDAADTLGLKARKYNYQIWRTDTNENHVLSEGVLTLKGHV